MGRYVRDRLRDGREGRLVVVEAQLTAAPGAAADEAKGVCGGGAEPLETAFGARDDRLLATHTSTIGQLGRVPDQTFVQNAR